MIHTLREFCGVIRLPEVRTIALLPHRFPDGDCIGSAVALYRILRSFGKEPVICANDAPPSNLAFVLEGADVRSYDPKVDACPVFDLAIGVDSSSEDLFEERVRLFRAAKRRIVVDHHLTNDEYGEVNFVDKTAAATGECVYDIAAELGVPIDSLTAQALYMAIVTDTGSFQYSSTTPRTFDIARALIAVGFDFERFNIEVYQSTDPANVQALRAALDHLAYRRGGEMATTYFEEADYADYGFSAADTDGVVEYIRAIRGIELVVFARALGGSYKYSLRSKRHVDVSVISKHYGGGGHKRASGFESSRPREEIFAEIDAMAGR